MLDTTTITTKIDAQMKQSPSNQPSVLAQESKKCVDLVEERQRGSIRKGFLWNIGYRGADHPHQDNTAQDFIAIVGSSNNIVWLTYLGLVFKLLVEGKRGKEARGKRKKRGCAAQHQLRGSDEVEERQRASGADDVWWNLASQNSDTIQRLGLPGSCATKCQSPLKNTPKSYILRAMDGYYGRIHVSAPFRQICHCTVTWLRQQIGYHIRAG
ncbi:hypothetical protein B0H14DRAFT_2642286 [Mycena olivaceomarginata]|nr:hypothetical protein B0H14DRAFT_2642286 [Mycena olivaceomarginata]